MCAKGNVLVLVVAILATWPLCADERAESRDSEIQRRYDTLLEQLTSRDVEARAHAWARLKPQRDLTVSVLQRIADPGGRPDLMRDLLPEVAQSLRRRAIEALGELRAVEAKDFLVGHMTVTLPPDAASEYSPFEDYPAAQAIVRVGEPAIQTMLFAGVGRSHSDEQLKLIAYVLWHYYAPQDEQDVGLFRIERLLEREKAEWEKYAKTRGLELGPSVRQSNLSRLIDMYNTINPHDPKDWPRPARPNPTEDESKVRPTHGISRWPLRDRCSGSRYRGGWIDVGNEP